MRRSGDEEECMWQINVIVYSGQVIPKLYDIHQDTLCREDATTLGLLSARRAATKPLTEHTSAPPITIAIGQPNPPPRRNAFSISESPLKTMASPEIARPTPDIQLLFASFLFTQIGRAHVCTPVTNAQLVCRLLLEKKKKCGLLHP